MGISQMTVSAFLDQLSSASPSPGGGCVSALAAAMAGATLAKVSSLTLGRPRLASMHSRARAIQEEAYQLQRDLLELAEADARAFDRVVAAYRLPKGTPAEAEHRAQEIRESMKVATDVPCLTAGACGRVLELCREAADSAAPDLFGDVVTAAVLAHASLRGSANQAQLNLAAINDHGYGAGVEQEMNRMLENGDLQLKKTLSLAQKRRRGGL